MFSLVNALLVRPLPYKQPERLVRVTGIYPRAAVPFFQVQSRTMDIAAVSTGSEFNLTGQGPAATVVGSMASPNFLSVLGASVARGRSFHPGEESPGRDNVVIVSDALWKDRFGGDPSALGRVIRLNGVDREIVGVMPASFSYPTARVQLWVPMRLDPSNFLEYWGSEFIPLIARLRPAATLPSAQSEVRNLMSQFRDTFPYPMARDFNADATAIPLQQDIVGDVRGKLIILLSSVALVLFIACANVASLLLSRATTRRREMALRAALGAGRLRVIRQLLTESVGLALTGAALGILLATVALSVFKSVLPSSLPGLAEAAIDWQILAAVTALALCTGLASGIAPALSASQVDIAETIKTGSQRSTSGFWTGVRSLIISGEVALTLVLLVSAGLLLRSLYKLSDTNPGFDPAHILTVRISPNQFTCNQRAACIALYDRLLERTSSIPGVQAAAVTNSVPLDGQLPTIAVDVEGHPKTDRASRTAVLVWSRQSGIFSHHAHSSSGRAVSFALRRTPVGRRRGNFGIHSEAFLAKPERHRKAHQIDGRAGLAHRRGSGGGCASIHVERGSSGLCSRCGLHALPAGDPAGWADPRVHDVTRSRRLGQWLRQKRHPAVGRRSGPERAGR